MKSSLIYLNSSRLSSYFSFSATIKNITILFTTFTLFIALGTTVRAETIKPVGWSTTFNLRYSQNFEESKAGMTPGFGDISNITTNDAIDGNVSIILRNKDEGEGIWLGFWPKVTPFSPNTIYSVEFDYRILKQQAGTGPIAIYFLSPRQGQEEYIVPGRSGIEPAENAGIFSAGSLLGEDVSDWWLGVCANIGSKVIIDNYKIYRSNPYEIHEQPEHWKSLKYTPFPRLGNLFFRGPYTGSWTSEYGKGCQNEFPHLFTVNEIESKLAFFDIVAGFDCTGEDPDFARRMRKFNPWIFLLSSEFAWKAGYPERSDYEGLTIHMHQQLLSGIADDWYVKDTKGNDILIPDWHERRMVNLSDFCPSVNGLTWIDYNISYLVDQLFKLGVWDGIFLNDLYGHIHPRIPNYNDPSLIDVDLNLNGIRDETPAFISDVARTAAIDFLKRIRTEAGDLEIIMVNMGAPPEIALAPYVNGYAFQCWSDAWETGSDWKSESGWRNSLDIYFQILKSAVSPKIIILEGCGSRIGWENKTEPGCNLSSEDFKAHRFMMGSALLGDGFYEYDLMESNSAPHWFDEYSVNTNGMAIEDRQYKGYLGQPLSDAVELKSPATIIWEEDFEAGIIPVEMSNYPGVYVSKEPNDVIEGTASLIFYEPDHTQIHGTGIGTIPDQLRLESDKTYLIEFDWTILETIDGSVHVGMDGLDYWPNMTLPGVVAGDTGKVHFPVTLNSGGGHYFSISLHDGGGKVAIDNIRVSEGGVGPWRRDFENGFVLVNPLNTPYTFNSDELSGPFNRNQIKRISGTQDPAVNNGHAVTDSLTLQPFDAIILLAEINQLPVSFAISPETCSFGECEVGSSSSQTVTITNTSEHSLTFFNKLDPGLDFQDFMVGNDTCSQTTVGPSEICTVEIFFSPTSAGLKNAKFTSRADEPGTSALNVNLNGQAIAPPSNDTGNGGGGGSCFISAIIN